MCFFTKVDLNKGKVIAAFADGAPHKEFDVTTPEARTAAAKGLTKIANDPNPALFLTDPITGKRVTEVVNNENGQCLDCTFADGTKGRLFDLSPKAVRDAAGDAN